MIVVTKLNKSVLVVNADLIEVIEKTPDTIITLTTGRKIMVTERLEDIIRLVFEYRSKTRAYPVPSTGPRTAANKAHAERRGGR